MSDKTEMLQYISGEWDHILQAFAETAGLHPGQLIVIGCSTSEVLGGKIGKASSREVADILIKPLTLWASRLEVSIAVQCCEHLNRVLIVEKKTAEKLGLESVIVMPSLSAGGALAVAAWDNFSEPIAVEQIKADAGIDIGDTFIGMHLRAVVVPVRIDIKSLGSAHVTLARTRPKYVGGPRAAYPCS
ncbi:TIGR01440 family protein [Dehalobacter sp. DCM]|uniref:TIGR01440 family protein n=1 Tax=Dehalobacter sp. DCM TaxID=2907827 RepID=UPI003081B444|nr:TIGR01440 family protein [Dehalobacter sp. DCM]